MMAARSSAVYCCFSGYAFIDLSGFGGVCNTLHFTQFAEFVKCWQRGPHESHAASLFFLAYS